MAKVRLVNGKPLVVHGKVALTDECCVECGDTTNSGACCLPDHSCRVTTGNYCTSIHGTYQGNGVPCSNVHCTATTGACCTGNTCIVTTAALCHGTYKGDGTGCDPNPCSSTGTARCCHLDGSCSDLSSADCTAIGGIFVPGTRCGDSACTCCTIVGAFSPGCTDGDGNCFTGPENCDGTCSGEMVACDSLWLSQNEYCITCPGGGLELCQTSIWNPLTCELTNTCFSHDCCAAFDCGTTQEVENQYIPCPP